MKLTKFEHSCLDIKEGNERLIIDPGVYSPSLKDYANITAVVITHIHPDHFDEAKLEGIMQANPAVQIFTTQEVADKLNSKAATVPEVGKQFKAGAFTLEFFGGQHAPIALTYPTNQNYGVLVNDTLYHPGDSFTPCPKPHTTLSLPVMAPWLKFSETADFLAQDSATVIFPTHNGFLNDDGRDLYARLIPMAAGQGKKYQYLAPGESLEI